MLVNSLFTATNEIPPMASSTYRWVERRLHFVSQPNLPGCQILTVTPASSRIRILVFTAGAGPGLGAPSFNTCFNLHFTSPPFLFKLFPLFFGLALMSASRPIQTGALPIYFWELCGLKRPQGAGETIPMSKIRAPLFGSILYGTRKQKRPVKKRVAFASQPAFCGARVGCLSICYPNWVNLN